MQSVAERLELSENFLWRVHSLVKSGKAYTSFKIPKRSGKSRIIHKPVDELQYVQTLIKSRILNEAPPLPECVTAFREGVSIRDNALVHCNKAILVKFDLKDFFTSVSFTRVLGIFESLGFYENDARGLAYLTTIPTDQVKTSPGALLHFEKLKKQEIADEAVSVIRSAISMHRHIDFGDLAWECKELSMGAKKIKAAAQKNKVLKRRGLPQGAPTSPQLANLAGKRMDLRLSGLADSLGFQYTRYADDLSFSSDDARAKTNVLARLVDEIVRDCGFVLNESKTSFMRAPATMQTTGLIVNGTQPRVRRQIVRRVRAMVHQYRVGSLAEDEVSRLKGYLSFIRMVNPAQAEKLETDLPENW